MVGTTAAMLPIYKRYFVETNSRCSSFFLSLIFGSDPFSKRLILSLCRIHTSKVIRAQIIVGTKPYIKKVIIGDMPIAISAESEDILVILAVIIHVIIATSPA